MTLITVLGLVVIICGIQLGRVIHRENREQAARDAHTDRVYRERGYEEKFEQMRRNSSERPEDWGDKGRWM